MSSDQIKSYCNCRQCYEEVPTGLSIGQYARLSIGLINPTTLRVWCERHNKLVTDFELLEPQPMTCEDCGGEVTEGHLH